MITHDKLFDQLLNNLRNLEGKTFKINEEANSRCNSARKNQSYSYLNIRKYDFRIVDDIFFCKNATDEHSKWQEICTINELSSIDDFSLSLSPVCGHACVVTLSLAFNDVDVFEESASCDGKVVEIDGKKYKLVEI